MYSLNGGEKNAVEEASPETEKETAPAPVPPIVTTVTSPAGIQGQPQAPGIRDSTAQSPGPNIPPSHQPTQPSQSVASTPGTQYSTQSRAIGSPGSPILGAAKTAPMPTTVSVPESTERAIGSPGSSIVGAASSETAIDSPADTSAGAAYKFRKNDEGQKKAPKPAPKNDDRDDRKKTYMDNDDLDNDDNDNHNLDMDNDNDDDLSSYNPDEEEAPYTTKSGRRTKKGNYNEGNYNEEHNEQQSRNRKNHNYTNDQLFKILNFSKTLDKNSQASVCATVKRRDRRR